MTRKGQEPPVRAPVMRLQPKTKAVAAWILHMASFHEHQPVSRQIHLSFCTRPLVYSFYMLEAEAATAQNLPVTTRLPEVSWSLFDRAWLAHAPHVVVRKHSTFSKCTTCDNWRADFVKSRCIKRRAELHRQLKAHVGFVMTERLQYKSKCHISKLQVRGTYC